LVSTVLLGSLSFLQKVQCFEHCSLLFHHVYLDALLCLRDSREILILAQQQFPDFRYHYLSLPLQYSMLHLILELQELLGAQLLIPPHPPLLVSRLLAFLHCCCGQAKVELGQASSLRLPLLVARFPLPPPLLAVKVVEELLVSRLLPTKACLRCQQLHSRFLVLVLACSHSILLPLSQSCH